MSPTDITRVKALARNQIAIKAMIEDLRGRHAALDREIGRLCGPGNLPDDDELLGLLMKAGLGSLVIERAGHKYTKYDEDRACRDEKLPPRLGEPWCDACQGESDSGRVFCGYCGRRTDRSTEVAP